MKDNWIIKLRIDIENKSDLIFTMISSSLFFTLLLTLPIYDAFLKYQPQINNFSNHVMSAATAVNLNVTARINSYLFLLFYVLVAGCIFFLLLYIKFNNCCKLQIDKKAIGFIRDASLIGIAAIIASMFTVNKDFAVYYIGIAVLLGWIFLSHKDDRKDFDMVIWSLLISFPFAVFIFVLSMHNHYITKLFQNWYMNQLQFSIFVVAILAWVLTSIVFYFFQRKTLNFTAELNINRFHKYKVALIICGIPFIFTVIVQSVLLEIFNILNKNYDLVFSRPYLTYIIIMILSTIISILFFFFSRNKRYLNISDIIYNLYMPIVLMSIAFMIAQPSRMARAGNEFFEIANAGLSVDQFFRYGSIPIIESFDAHMMSNQIFAYLYSFLNGYEPWALFLYNNYAWLIYILPMFYILKKLIGSINSFLMILCFPLITNLFSGLYLLSGLVAICVIRMISSNKITDRYLFWITVFLLCIYRLDLGFGVLLGGLLTYFVSCYSFNEKSDVKIFLTGGIVGSILLLLFTLLCLLKGINPLIRFIEFMKLCLSNQSWAYSSVGNSEMLAYVIGYYILPLFVVFFAVLIIAKNTIINRSKGIINNSNMYLINKDALIMAIFFTAFFIFNTSRGIVRHSFQENTILFILGTIPLAMVSFVVINNNSNLKILKFLVTSLVLITLINLNNASYKNMGASLILNALTSQSYQEQYTPSYAFNGTRISGSVMQSDAESLKLILDTVLTPQETYYDFASVNYLYALVGRKNPVYVNQSPLMISDDLTQKYALQQIKTSNPPIVLMPINGNIWSTIDGIPVDYKYYMISEYIYKNYTPLIRLPMFDIYCLKEKKNSYVYDLAKDGLMTKILYNGNFDFINIQKLSYNNSEAQIDSNGNIVLIPSGNDPYVFGFMKQFRAINKVNNIGGTKIKLDFYSKSTGSFQLFYTLDENEKFSEKQSKMFTVNTEGQNTAVIDLPSMPNELRIDIDTKELILENLTISQGLQPINDQPEIWVRNLGEIPRLWAEKDRSKIFLLAPSLQVPKKETTSFTANTETIPLNEPMYLLIQLDSPAQGTATVEIGELQNKFGEFNFTVSKGRHLYVLRLSTDYHWWSNENRYIHLTTNQPVDIYKLSFLSVDSLKYYNNESGYFLSNITDTNWHGGVGITINAVLFDNSPRNKNILQSATELVFNDGRLAKILSIKVDRAYIQVAIDGEVSSFANVASYPNKLNIK